MSFRNGLIVLGCAATVGLGGLSGCASAPSREAQQQPSGSEMFVDAVAVRPMTLGASAVGLAAWVLTLPFTIPSGGAADAGKSWVVDPLGYTFVRPLGDIGDAR